MKQLIIDSLKKVETRIRKWFLERGVKQGKVFKLEDTFYFAVQVPDETVGCSGSRCSNCNTRVDYSEQFCENCQLPFIGPHGVQQIEQWKQLSPEGRNLLVKTVFEKKNHGRIVSSGAAFPLTPEELAVFKELEYGELVSFFPSNGIYPGEVEDMLMS